MAAELEEEILENGEVEIYTMEDLVEWASRMECTGVVSKYEEIDQDDFYYLRLPDSWQIAIPFFISNVSRLLQYDKQSKANIFKLIHAMKEKCSSDVPSAESATFFQPPGNVGLHISIAKDTLGRVVPFRITKVMRYTNQGIGNPSQFDNGKYVAEWVALRVELEEGSGVGTVSSPHISIAAFGFEVQVKEKSNAKSKKSKKGKN